MKFSLLQKLLTCIFNTDIDTVDYFRFYVANVLVYVLILCNTTASDTDNEQRNYFLILCDQEQFKIGYQ